MPSKEAKLHIFNKIGYEPNPDQARIHFDDHRIKEVVGGVRGGKSTTGAREITSQFWLGKLYWLIGADYEQCRPEFGYLVDDFQKLGVIKNVSFPNRDQCILVIEPDIVIETKSAKYKEKIAGKALDGILLCEAAQMPYDIFTRSIERLSEKRGWLLATGTLETSLDWYSDLYKDFQIPDNKAGAISISLPSWSNTAIFPGGRNDPEILRAEQILGQDLFMERYGGVPVKPKGIVFKEFKSTLHTGSFPVDMKEPVYICVDPGYYPSAYSVGFLQFFGDDIYVVDEIYEQYLITEQIITIVQKKPYYQNIAGGAIDIGSKQHQGQKPVYDIWLNKTGLHLDTRRILIQDGVDRLRTFLLPHPVTGEVNIHIDQSCRGLISEFGGCRSPLNTDGGQTRGAWKMKMDRQGNVLSEKPEEKNCDAIKGLIYGIVSRYGLATKKRKPGVSYIDIGG